MHTFRAIPKAGIASFRRAGFRLRRAVGRVGVSRHGVLAASRRLYPHSATTPLRRLASLVIGASFIGVGVTLLVQANLGLSPYDVMVSGVRNHLPLSFGQTVWLCSAVMFGIAALLREFPSRWGIAYVVAVGFAIDGAADLINAPTHLSERVAFVFAGLVVIATGIALVVHSGSTGGSFELLMRAGENRGLPRAQVRTGLEVGVLVFGVLLGGSIGFATFVVAAGIGPLLVVIGQALSDHDAGREARLQARHARDAIRS